MALVSWSFRAGQWEEKATTAFKLAVSRFAASVVATALAFGFWLFSPPEFQKAASDIAGYKISEMMIGIAAISGTALALVVSLFIIPAQKAAEAYSPAILHLFVKDSIAQWMLIFLSIVALLGTLASTNWFFGLNSGQIILVGLFALGLSLDALRAFYKRVASLLIPDTALELVLADCRKAIAAHRKSIETMEEAGRLAFGPSTSLDGMTFRAFAHKSYPQTKAFLGLWCEQLVEFGRRAIMRGDTLAAIKVAATLTKVGNSYVDARGAAASANKRGVLIIDTLTSEVQDVLNPISDGLLEFCRRAGRSDSEDVAIAAIRGLEELSRRASSIKMRLRDDHTKEPLVLKVLGYLDECVKHVSIPGFADCRLEFSRSVLRVHKSIDHTGSREVISAACSRMQGQIAAACYIHHEAAIAQYVLHYMLTGVGVDIQHHAWQCRYPVIQALAKVATLLPLEIQVRPNAPSLPEAFQPYSTYNDEGVAHLLRLAIQADQFKEKAIAEVSEALDEHFIHVGYEVEFKKGQLPYDFCASALESADLLIDYIGSAPEVSKDPIRQRIRSFVQVPLLLFSSGDRIEPGDAVPVAELIGYLAIRCIEYNEFEIVETCSQVLRQLGKYVCQRDPSKSYFVADVYAVIHDMEEAASLLNAGRVLPVPLEAAFALDIQELSKDNWAQMLSSLQSRLRRRETHARPNWRGHPSPSIALERLRKPASPV